MRTSRDAKIMAKTLRSEVAARTGADLSHSAALEIVARQFGFDDWNVLAARIAAGSSQIVPAFETSGLALTDPRRATTSTIPVLRIFAEDRDGQPGLGAGRLGSRGAGDALADAGSDDLRPVRQPPAVQ